MNSLADNQEPVEFADENQQQAMDEPKPVPEQADQENIVKIVGTLVSSIIILSIHIYFIIKVIRMLIAKLNGQTIKPDPTFHRKWMGISRADVATAFLAVNSVVLVVFCVYKWQKRRVAREARG